jgi:hypothetical protein
MLRQMGSLSEYPSSHRWMSYEPRNNHRPATLVSAHSGDHGHHQVAMVNRRCDDLRLLCWALPLPGDLRE